MATTNGPEPTLPTGTIRPPDGEMRRLTYAKDWSGTPLGPINQWPSIPFEV